MNRPKRAATQKPLQKQKLKDLDLSDLDDDDSDDGDFSSQSSDEYDPGAEKENIDQSDVDEEIASEHSDGSGEEEESSPEKDKNTNARCSRNNNRQRRKSFKVATLHKEVINKFRSSSQRTSSTSQKLNDIFKKAEFKKFKHLLSSDDESDKIPEFDCSGGLQLSESSDSENAEEHQPKSSKAVLKMKTTSSQDGASEDFDKNMQKMKEIASKLAGPSHSQAHASYNSSQKENVNVADLLAMGENERDDNLKLKASKKQTQASQKESDSDWEDVEDDDTPAHKFPKEGVEIILNNIADNERGKKSAKPVDLAAQLKRKFNRRRKEYQEYLHKTELLSWIAHGNFVNQRLNDMNLIENALKLLPKNHGQCYPRDKTDMDYFKQITTWFKQEISLKNQEMYCTRLKNRPPLMTSLALQMKFKAAICRRDYVLIYVILLRAIGIQCRMVQSIVCDPKVCPKSELMSLSLKKSNEKAHKSTSKSKSSKGKVKIPQLDGGDNDIPENDKRNKRALRSAANDAKKATTARSTDTENFSPKIKFPLINSPNRTKKTSLADTKNAKKKLENEPTQGALKIFSPRKTRSKSHDIIPPTIIQQKASTSKTAIESTSNKGKADIKTKATVVENKPTQEALKIFSPRKTRSKSQDIIQQKASTSKTAIESNSNKGKADIKTKAVVKKDTLKIVLPIRTRSKSNEKKDPTAKPNLQNLKRKPNDMDSAVVPSKTLRISAAPTTSKSASELSKNTSSENEAKSSRKRPAGAKEEVQKKVAKRVTKISESSDNDSLKYFKNVNVIKKSQDTSKIDRRVISTDEDDEKEEVAKQVSSTSPKKSKGIDIWVEVYSEKDERWIAIDVFRGKIDCAKEVTDKATHPLVYVFAWNNDNSIKDVSARYCAKFNTVVNNMRVVRNYLNSVLNLFPGTRTARDLKEDDELNKIQLKEVMPTRISDFKKHPIYALKRHLLKFQAIYPPEPPILGYIREEAIYPRDCVFTLHSRETWLKEARVVKLHEKPYKMTTTMKWDRAKNKLIKDVPLELFGMWQTKDFEPPVAENGMVPRNAYGNVELFKPSMLPIGTVHLQLPSLNKVCKKIGVDCAQAVVGFDSNGGWPYPVYDGFIVCKEFEEKVIDAWNRDQEEMERKEQEKYEKRVYGNWKKLIKGLYIRERLKNKYNL